MNKDLKIIKKKYGEKMMHLCRELFSTILDNHPGVLSQIMLETFAPNHFLYDDVICKTLVAQFNNFIYARYCQICNFKELPKQPVADPVTLMKQAGYTLYECTCEEDIQAFRKYYADGEELCTFNGERLNHCYVYFAVRDNADKLNRKNYSSPQRQDEYGTSVISIQFTRNDNHILSIKNRYNHTVSNPDATFSNNLDNIIPGLTQSFEDYYGMKQEHPSIESFELPRYIRANDGKFYKYNYEINNICYCPDNIVIDNFEVQTYPQEKYLVMDYFILDLVNKRFINNTEDSFDKTIPTINKINVKNDDDKKVVTITPDVGEDIIIVLDKFNQIIGFKNDNLKEIPNKFLWLTRELQNISIKNATVIGNDFLLLNMKISKISLPEVTQIGNDFIPYSRLKKITLPKVTIVGDRFLREVSELKAIELPELISAGNSFLSGCTYLKSISLPKVERIGYSFLKYNCSIERLSLPEVKVIGGLFCYNGRNIVELDLPNLESIGHDCLIRNKGLTEIYLPKVKKIGEDFMRENPYVKRVNLPNVQWIGSSFIARTFQFDELYVPKLKCFLNDNLSRSVNYQNNSNAYCLKKKRNK